MDMAAKKKDLNGKAEVFQHLAAAETSYGERAAVEVLAQPSSLQHQLEERRAERARQMKSPFAPIEAAKGEAPSH